MGPGTVQTLLASDLCAGSTWTLRGKQCLALLSSCSNRSASDFSLPCMHYARCNSWLTAISNPAQDTTGHI